MGTLIRMKAEVNNPELPVVTEQGILPYYEGLYVNKLADMGVTLTQTEVNALSAFISELNDAGVLDKIDTFYPFMGNVNVPLVGSTELTFNDTTSTNTKLDFVNGKLRGVKAFDNMPTVKYKNLSSFRKGFNIGCSIITNSLSTETGVGSFFTINGVSTYPAIQLRFKGNGSKYTLTINDLSDSSTYINFFWCVNLPTDSNLHNYSGVCGIVNENYRSEPIAYSRVLIKDNTILMNEASSIGSITPLATTDISEFNIAATSTDTNNKVLTTLAFFKELLTANQNKAFCEALDTFTAAVGKTVSVG